MNPRVGTRRLVTDEEAPQPARKRGGGVEPDCSQSPRLVVLCGYDCHKVLA